MHVAARCIYTQSITNNPAKPCHASRYPQTTSLGALGGEGQLPRPHEDPISLQIVWVISVRRVFECPFGALI